MNPRKAWRLALPLTTALAIAGAVFGPGVANGAKAKQVKPTVAQLSRTPSIIGADETQDRQYQIDGKDHFDLKARVWASPSTDGVQVTYLTKFAMADDKKEFATKKATKVGTFRTNKGLANEFTLNVVGIDGKAVGNTFSGMLVDLTRNAKSVKGTSIPGAYVPGRPSPLTFFWDSRQTNHIIKILPSKKKHKRY